MNAFKVIPNEELVDKLEKYKLEVSWEDFFDMRKETHRTCSEVLGYKDEIWDLTMEVYNEYLPPKKHTRENIKERLGKHYRYLITQGNGLEYYVNCVASTMTIDRRNKCDIKRCIRHKFLDHIEETSTQHQPHLKTMCFLDPFHG